MHCWTNYYAQTHLFECQAANQNTWNEFYQLILMQKQGNSKIATILIRVASKWVISDNYVVQHTWQIDRVFTSRKNGLMYNEKVDKRREILLSGRFFIIYGLFYGDTKTIGNRCIEKEAFASMGKEYLFTCWKKLIRVVQI